MVAGDGENGLNPRVGGKESIHRHADATVQLFRGGPRRHREVESIHESCSPQRNEAQDGRFRLSGSGFTFQDQERLIQWRLSHSDLSRPRPRVGEQRSNIIGYGAYGAVGSPEPLTLDGGLRESSGTADIARVGGRLKWKDCFVRPDLIGERDDSGKQMRKRRGLG